MKKAPTTVSNWPLYLWFLYPIFYPYYFFSSGLPQPSDVILVILIGVALASGWKLHSFDFITKRNSLKAFVAYVVVVNTIWFLFIDQSNEKPFPSIFHSAFYIYNFFVFVIALLLYERFRLKFVKFTAYSLGISLLVQAVWAVVTNAAVSRSPLFFNNPNQLGYYALLSGTILTLITSKFRINILFQIASYFSFLLLCLVSSSKAAMAGALLLIVLAFVNQGLLNFKQLVAIAVVVLIGNYFVMNIELGKGLFNYSANRFETIGESGDDSAEGRGYDRIINNPEYLFLGAGEGGYYRFETAIELHEIHSTFGTVLFSYGVIGFYLFMAFLIQIYKGGRLFNFFYSLPAFIYSITHQGLRSTLFWILLAIVCIMSLEFKNSIRAKANNKYRFAFHRNRVPHLKRKSINEIKG